MARLHTLRGLLGLIDHRTDQELIDQYFITLNATYEHLARTRTEADQATSEALRSIDEMLRGERNWRHAYEVEQRLSALMSGEWLEMELGRRLLEVRQHLPVENHQFYQQGLESYGEEGKRAMLARIVNDLQWHYEVVQAHNLFGGLCRIRTGLVFALSFVLFFLPFIMPSIATSLNVHVGTKSYYVLTALSAGWMGAAFSMLLRLRSTLDKSDIEELKVISRYSYILTRVIVGMGASLIFYYFMEAGLLGGTFLPSFPAITYPGLTEVVCSEESIKSVKLMQMDEKSLALLIIWSFIAGFSEQMVPNVLKSTEQQRGNGRTAR